MQKSQGQTTVQSVDNVLRLLMLFATSPTVRVSDVADHLGVARSTAHRLLTTLAQRGFAVQDSPSRVYRPGPRLMEVGLAAVGNLDIRSRARPHLEILARESEETVSLLVADLGNVRFVDSIESHNSVRVGSRLGLELPAHATSGGKAMLACMSAESFEELYPSEELHQVTELTVHTRTQLLAELTKIRDDGYAFNAQESEVGLGAAGVAVRDPSGRPVAALAVAGPAQRMHGDHLDAIVASLRRAAVNISVALYGGGPEQRRGIKA